MQRLTNCWKLLGRLYLNEEEKPVFINMCLWRFRELVIQEHFGENEPKLGVFANLFYSVGSLSKYEQVWKKQVVYDVCAKQEQFVETMQELQKQRQINADCMKDLLIFSKAVPRDIGFHHICMSLQSLPDHSRKLFQILERFIHKRHALKYMALVPDLVHFYQWLHATFSYLISEEDALQTSVVSLIRQFMQSVDKAKGTSILRLFNRIKVKWNNVPTGGLLQQVFFYATVILPFAVTQQFQTLEILILFLLSSQSPNRWRKIRPLVSFFRQRAVYAKRLIISLQ